MKHTTEEQKKIRLESRAQLFEKVVRAIQDKNKLSTFVEVGKLVGVAPPVISNTIAGRAGGLDLDRICEIAGAQKLDFGQKNGKWEVLNGN